MRKKFIFKETKHKILESPSTPTLCSTATFCIGELVWGAARGHPAWPGKIVSKPESYKGVATSSDSTWVQWFGGRPNVELVSINSLKSLSEGLEAHHKAQKDTRKWEFSLIFRLTREKKTFLFSFMLAVQTDIWISQLFDFFNLPKIFVLLSKPQNIKKLFHWFDNIQRTKQNKKKLPLRVGFGCFFEKGNSVSKLFCFCVTRQTIGCKW